MPTGYFNFQVNGVGVANVPVVNGVAEFNLTPSYPGSTQTVRAVFVGTPGYLSSVSDSLSYVVNQAHAFLSLSTIVRANGRGLTLVGTVTTSAVGIVPTGSLTFYRTSRPVMSVGRAFRTINLAGNQASILISRLNALGRHFFVRYNGDANFGPSQSQTLNITRSTFIPPRGPALAFHARAFRAPHRGR